MSARWYLIGIVSLLAAAALAASTAFGSAPGGTVPVKLAGLYEATFGPSDAQTAGVWHLRLGPGHHLRMWNTKDAVASSPSFEIGPVSYAGGRILFPRATADGVCVTAAAYSYRLSGSTLRLRPVGTDPCNPREITLAPHPWHRVGR
jgi:hypothetical protein